MRAHNHVHTIMVSHVPENAFSQYVRITDNWANEQIERLHSSPSLAFTFPMLLRKICQAQ